MKSRTVLIAVVFSVLLDTTAFSQPMPVYRWASIADDSAFNNNPSEAVAVPVPCTVPYHDSYTVIAVYTTGEDSSERAVWTLDYGAEGCNGLTTMKLSYKGYTSLYDSVNRRGPVINSLMQSSPVGETAMAPKSITG